MTNPFSLKGFLPRLPGYLAPWLLSHLSGCSLSVPFACSSCSWIGVRGLDHKQAFLVAKVEIRWKTVWGAEVCLLTLSCSLYLVTELYYYVTCKKLVYSNLGREHHTSWAVCWSQNPLVPCRLAEHLDWETYSRQWWKESGKSESIGIRLDFLQHKHTGTHLFFNNYIQRRLLMFGRCSYTEYLMSPSVWGSLSISFRIIKIINVIFSVFLLSPLCHIPFAEQIQVRGWYPEVQRSFVYLHLFTVLEP